MYYQFTPKNRLISSLAWVLHSFTPQLFGTAVVHSIFGKDISKNLHHSKIKGQATAFA